MGVEFMSLSAVIVTISAILSKVRSYEFSYSKKIGTDLNECNYDKIRT